MCGIAYRYGERLTLRGGYNHASSAVTAAGATVGFLMQGVIQNHLALGLGDMIHSVGELTLAYMRAFENSVNETLILQQLYRYAYLRQ